MALNVQNYVYNDIIVQFLTEDKQGNKPVIMHEDVLSKFLAEVFYLY